MIRNKLWSAALVLIASMGVTTSARAGLVAHWTLDDNAANTVVVNSVNAANNASFTVNTDTRHVAGKVGTGALNIGNNTGIIVNNPAGLQNGLTDFTVSAWVIGYPGGPDEMVLTFGGINYPTSGGGDYRIQAEIYNNRVASYYRLNTGSGNSLQSVDLTWNSGTWYHVVWAQNGGTMRMYRDGTELGVASGSPTGRPTPAALNQDFVQIGALAGYGGSFSGAIDDVQLYDKGLSATEVRFLLDNPGAALPATPLLVAHYKMDENAASPTVIDSSASGLNGTLENTSQTPINTSAVSVLGKADRAFNHNSAARVDLNAHADAFTSLSDFTVSLWVKGSNPNGQLFNWSDGTNNNRIQLEIYNNGLTSYAQGSGSAIGTPLTWDPDTWYHLVFTQEDGHLKGYRTNDGLTPSLDAMNRPLPAANPSLSMVTLGGLDIAAEYFYPGNIDDVQIYTRALGTDDILLLYNNPGLTLDQMRAIPEPATFSLIVTGLLGLGVYRGRKWKKRPRG